MSTFISRYIKFFFIADFLLILAHILGKQYWLVNLDIEYNIPTLFSSVQIFLVALVIWPDIPSGAKPPKRYRPGKLDLAAARCCICVPGNR